MEQVLHEILNYEVVFLPNEYVKDWLYDSMVYIYNTIEEYLILNLFITSENLKMQTAYYNYIMSKKFYLHSLNWSCQYLFYIWELVDSYGYTNFCNWFDISLANIRYISPIIFNSTLYSVYTTKICSEFFTTNFILNLNVSYELKWVAHNIEILGLSLIDYGIFLVLVTVFIQFLFKCDRIICGLEDGVEFSYLKAAYSVGSEKELSALDDFFQVAIPFLFFSGWFFYCHGLVSFFHNPLTILFFLAFPLVVYILFGIPVCLLVDFGFRFINFLRGIAGTSSLVVEFTFDYINFAAFLLRTFVQNVRFLLILLVCYSLNELMCEFDFCSFIFKDSETLILDILCGEYVWDVAIFKLLIHISKWILYLLYELLHAFFIIVVQFSAFLIMVFWLFSFLYTYFTKTQKELFFSLYRKTKIEKQKFNKKHNIHPGFRVF